MNCRECGRVITEDEAAMTKKLVNRGTSEYYCFGCLAEAFDVTQEDIQRKMQYYKEIGCTLFVCNTGQLYSIKKI